MIDFPWMVMILTVTLSLVFGYLAGKGEDGEK